jgi:hypothetical protein
MAIAPPPSDTLLPSSVVGYVSVANPAQFDQHWNKTQIGQMFADELMQPFLEDLKRQLDTKLNGVEKRLGITRDDLKGVPAGELSFSIIERHGSHAAVAITLDVTGHQEQAQAFLSAVEEHFAARGGHKQDVEHAGTTLHVFEIPATQPDPVARTTVYFVKNDLLVGIDDRGEAEAILDRFSGEANDDLRSAIAYQTTMERCQREAAGIIPEVRWFVDPFRFVFAARTLRGTPRPTRRDDYAKLLSEQGFDAIKGVGGHVNLLAEGGVEVHHRTAVYAPPVAGKESDPLRWDLSMRMLQLPNAKQFEPQSWVPRMTASYTALNLQIGDAFDNFGPIFDAMQGHEGAWKNTLEGWEVDPYGPQINVRKEFIENMGTQVSIVTDYVTPISPASERSIFAVEAKDEKQLAEALAKWMRKEPDVERRDINGIEVWERVQRAAEIEQIAIDVPGFSTLDTEAKKQSDEERDRERVLPNSATCVALGHLLVTSDINYLRDVLAGFGQHERLASSLDYQQVAAVMNKLAPGDRSLWSFARSDEEIRPTYELVRQGKMPESESMLGKLLNDLLTTDVEKEEGILRKQRIDGSKLPSFEAVRRYFGPAGRTIRSDQDGWFISGIMLNKESP